MGSQGTLDSSHGCELVKNSQFQCHRVIYCCRQVNSLSGSQQATSIADTMKSFTLLKSRQKKMKQSKTAKYHGEFPRLSSHISEET